MATQYHMILVTTDGGASARFDVQPERSGDIKWHGPTRLDGASNPGVQHDVRSELFVAVNGDNFDLELNFPSANRDNKVTVDPLGVDPPPAPRLAWDDNCQVATITFGPEHAMYNFDVTCVPGAAAGPVPNGVKVTVRVRTGTSPQPGPPLHAAR